MSTLFGSILAAALMAQFQGGKFVAVHRYSYGEIAVCDLA
jgi:hypothetical protein